MATTNVNILIAAKSLVGGVVKGAISQLQGLQSAANKVGGAVGTAFSALKGINFTSAVDAGTKALGGMNLGLVAILGTVGLVTVAFQKMTSSLNAAVTREVDNLNVVNTAITTLGLSEAKASDFVEDFNKQLATLGKDLPTSAENINVIARTIFDDYSLALKGAGKSTDQIRDQLLQSASKIAVTAEGSNVDLGTTKAAISAFLGGGVGGERGLQTYTFFGNNPLLKKKLTEGLKSSGKESFTEMSALERVNLLTKALDEALPQSAIARLQNTTKAKFSAFMDTLFDPELGIFSIQRDLDPKMKGYQSVYSSFQTTIDLIIGSEGILGQFARISGISSDAPMKAFKNAVENLNGFLKRFAVSMTFIKKGDWGDTARTTGKYLAEITNAFFNGMLKAVGSINYGGLAMAAFEGIGSFLKNLDWKIYVAGGLLVLGGLLVPAIIGIGTLVAGALVAAVGGTTLLIGAAIALAGVGIVKGLNDNWGAVSKYFSNQWEGLTNFLKADFQNLTGTVSSLWNDYIWFLRNDWTILTIQVGHLWRNYIDFIKKDFENLQTTTSQGWNSASTAVSKGWTGYTNFLEQDFNNLIKFTSNSVKFLGDTAGRFISGMTNGIAKGWNTFVGFLQEKWRGITDYVRDKFSPIINGIQSFISTIESLLNLITNPVQTFASTISSGANTVTETATNVVQSTVNTAKNVSSNVSNAASTTVNKAVDFAAGLFGLKPKFAGHIPTAANGIIGAIQQEKLNAPNNTGLVLANSSETILTPNQLNNLVSKSVDSGRRSSNNIVFNAGAFVFNINGDNANDTASRVLEILENSLISELENRLA